MTKKRWPYTLHDLRRQMTKKKRAIDADEPTPLPNQTKAHKGEETDPRKSLVD